MSMFGIGSSKSSSQSNASSSSFERSLAESFGIGSSYGENASSQNVYLSDLFQGLFQKSTNVAGSIATDEFSAMAGDLYGTGFDVIGQLRTMMGGEPQGAGEQYLADRVNGPGTIEAQIAQLEADMGQFFNEQVMPGVRGDAIAAGGMNGSRFGVAQGMAVDSILRQFTAGATTLRTNDQGARDAAAATLAGSVNARRTNAAQLAIGALPQVLGLAESGNMAALQPLLALSSIMGGPTVLTDAYGYDTSAEQSGSRSESTATSSSQSTATSKSRSFDVNLGWGP